MDLALYARVIWRFRFVVLIGLLLAVALALLSFVRVSFKGGSLSLSYRQAEAWQSNTKLLVTGKGFPQAQAYVAPTATPTAASETAAPSFVGTATYFSLLANSDAVRRILTRDKSLQGSMVAAYDVDPVTKDPLPVLVIGGIASSPSMAARIAARGAVAFRAYVTRKANEAGIPPKQRVKLSVLNAPAGAVLVTKRKKTVPIVIFLTVMIAAIGLAFVLENLRPPIRVVENRPDAELPRRRADSP